jgi:hypothetical protein
MRPGLTRVLNIDSTGSVPLAERFVAG